MRKVYLENIKGTEVIAKDIFDASGRILLSEGTVIKTFYVNKLKQMDVFAVYVKDALSDGIEIEETISEKLKVKVKKIIKEDMKKLISDNQGIPEGILKSTGDIIDELLSKKDIMVNLSDIRSKEDSLLSHSIQVCTLSVITGIRMGYNMLKLKDIAVGALMHDIGQLLLPEHIIKKQGDLTEEEMIIFKQHPKQGYDLLNKQHNINATAKVMVLLHHERNDGSGYPLGLTEDKIYETAKLIAVCDVFDNMTADVGNKKGMKPYEVIEYLYAMSGTLFDKRVVEVFVKNISPYPLGSGVLLNNQQKGIVYEVHKDAPTRPIVKIVYDEHGERLKEPVFMNLLKEMTLFVVDIVDL